LMAIEVAAQPSHLPKPQGGKINLVVSRGRKR
jgi:hypothetical protein